MAKMNKISQPARNVLMSRHTWVFYTNFLFAREFFSLFFCPFLLFLVCCGPIRRLCERKYFFYAEQAHIFININVSVPEY